ncbi:MAG: HAD family hydrolase [Proteobacteria bacterium]|nr:HAD family hydrolase [Pseudomonadota bacterium]
MPPWVPILERLRLRVRLMAAADLSPVVVFDLDDTLFSTTPRHLRILREYVSQGETRDRWMDDAWRLSQLERHHLRYSITETAQSVGVTRVELLKDLREFWYARFFRNDYIEEDAPIAGAAEYCAAMLEEGALLVYLTGRDETMRRGSEAALKRHAFPLPDGGKVRLMLKPRFDIPDPEFKAEAARRCAALGEVVGTFENEPAHVNLFQDAFPAALHVLLDTRHSGKPVEPHPAAHRIPDFSR